MTDRKTFLILDGNALLHRAWHAVPPLTTKDGRMVNAAYGFTNVVDKMLRMFSPDFMAVAWDLEGPTFRHNEFTPYKAHREKKAQELYDQIPIIQEVLRAYGIPSLSAEGFEADDVIGTLASHNAKKDYETLIVTGDRDLLQLVDDHTKVVFFVKGLSETATYDVDAVQKKYGLLPPQLIDLKTMLGDTSDNIPGIRGLGEKSATSLMQQFGSVEKIFAALKKGDVPAKFTKKLEGQEKLAEQMRRLVTIVRDVDLMDFDVSKAAVGTPNLVLLLPLLRDLEFKVLLKKYEGGSEEGEKKGMKSAVRKTPLGEISGRRIAVVLVPKAADLFGGSVEWVGIFDGERMFCAEHPSESVLKEITEKIAVTEEIIGYDVKGVLHALAHATKGMPSVKACFDVMVAAYLLSSGDREVAFTDIVRQELRYEAVSPLTQLTSLFDLSDALHVRLKKDGMEKLASDIEMPLVPILFRMEYAGIHVDVKKLTSLSKTFDERLEQLTKEIHKLAGKEFNINSPSQFAEVLFDDLKIPTKGIKKTQTGFSTAAPELEKLVECHAIIPLILEYRELAKLKSTYADALPKLVAADGRIHAQFNQCVAATGRLSSSNPNLQNIPVRTELGREIRKAFVAKPHHVLLSADYSQIELRLAAIVAKDEAFLSAFKDGADIHRRTAAEMWDIDEERVTKDQRFAAKAINFGILYGIGPRSLGRSAGVSFDEAREYIDRYFSVHHGVQEYLDETKIAAHRDEFVQTMFGRRRYLPDVNSGVPQLVAAAERMAINMPIQGAQADIIKMAMERVDTWIAKSSLRITMLLQVHDELVFEVHEDDVKNAQAEIPGLMSDVVALEIPLIVDVAVGKNWGDL